MNNLKINQHSSTVGVIVIMTALSGQLVDPEANNVVSSTNTNNANYELNNNSSTFSAYSNLHQDTVNQESLDIVFEEVTSNFYSELLTNQEPLGEEFEKVLYDNLWDLYES